MRKLILTSLLIAGCGNGSSSGSFTGSGGSSVGGPESIYQGLINPTPSVLVKSDGLRIFEPYSHGVILHVNRQGQVILRGEVIAADEGLAEVLRDMFDAE